jgi:glycosyltransferase involved in cell wall biosynthesis
LHRAPVRIEGPGCGALERIVAALGVQVRVELPVYGPEIRLWLDRARLFVLSLRCEGYGVVSVESLAAGRSLVATRCTSAVGDL